MQSKLAVCYYVLTRDNIYFDKLFLSVTTVCETKFFFPYNYPCIELYSTYTVITIKIKCKKFLGRYNLTLEMLIKKNLTSTGT